MPIYLLGASTGSEGGDALEKSIRQDIPDLVRVGSVEELRRRLPAQSTKSEEGAYLLFPFSETQIAIDRLVEMATQARNVVFFIFISEDVSASDYKRLVRTGNADWVSARGAPHEIREVIARHRRGRELGEAQERRKSTVVSFVPSAGGVGNSTIAIETALQVKTHKQTRDRDICLIDLDFQSSHICDLLDIEARLQIAEIVASPERLDAQLFELFVSHHSTGIDVLAGPRSKNVAVPSITALDALFGMMSARYGTIFADLPVPWVDWTPQILSVSDLVVVTGLNTIPGLRQVTETVKAVRELQDGQRQIVVALNRCESRLLGGVADQNYASRMLEGQTIFYIREDAATARQSVNTGVPAALSAPSSKISKDIRPLTRRLAALGVAELAGQQA